MNFIIIFKIATITASIISVFMTGYSIRKRKVSIPFLYYTGLMAACSVYTIGYLLEIHMQSLQNALICLNFEYIGISFIPFFWILLAWSYNPNDLEHDTKIKKIIKFLVIIPVVIILLIWTNPAHHFMYRGFSALRPASDVLILQANRAAGFWIANILLIVLYLTGISRFIYNVINTKGRLRRHSLLLILASSLPIIAHILLLLQIVPYRLDIVPIASSVTGLMVFWWVLKAQLFDLLPIARKLVLNSMDDFVFIIDDKDRLIDCNKVAKSIFLGEDFNSFGRNINELLPSLWEKLKDITITTEIDLDINGKDQNFRVSASEIEHNAYGHLGKIYILHDISALKYYIKKLEKLASFDSLTGLFNRRHFLKLAAVDIARAERTGGHFSIVIFDLDKFKSINDKYGHLAGDAVLQMIGRHIQSNMRTSDFFGRYGGEEFVLLYHNAKPEGAEGSVERLRKSIAETPVSFGGGLIRITASFGISYYEAKTGCTLEKCLQQADDAMYKAKRDGGNRICHYSKL